MLHVWSRNHTSPVSFVICLGFPGLFLLHRQQLKAGDTVNKPAGGCKPDLALAYSAGNIFESLIINDILCAEPLIRVSISMVSYSVNSLGHITIWLWLANENLSSSSFYQLSQVFLFVFFEGSKEIKMTSIQ